MRNNKVFSLNKKNNITKAIISVLSVSPLSMSFAEEVKSKVSENDIEVVTVMAQKRVQNILKVPVTVSSVSEDTIEESGSIGLQDIDKFIPGFKYDASMGMTQSETYMRGVTSPSIGIGGDPSTAIFYDDVYMPSGAQNVLFTDMARVEVLKGPQGTLFGRNAAMGVVSMVPKSPFSDFEGFFKATLGSDNLARYEGMINVPLSENVYIRANALTNSQDGFVDNIATPSWNEGTKVWDFGERDHSAARIAVLWDISDNTNFQLSYEWDDLDQAAPMAVGVSEYGYNMGQTPFANKAENDVMEGGEKRDMTSITTKLEHEFSDEWSAKYIASYREWEINNTIDEDGTADKTRYFDTVHFEDSNIFYTELQLNYSSDRINAVTGFSYSKEDVKQRTDFDMTADSAARLVTGQLNDFIQAGVADQVSGMIGGNADANAEAAFGPGVTFDGAVDAFFAASGFPMDHLWNSNEWANALTVLGFSEDIMTAIGMPGEPLTADVVNATGDLTYDIVSQQLGIAEVFGPSFTEEVWQESIGNTGKFSNWGVYGDIEYSITDDWIIIGGLRYSEDKKDFSWNIPLTNFSTSRPGVNNILFPQANLATSDSWSQTTGRLVTSYQLSDEHMVFASYSTGYKSGGFDFLSPSTESFSPEDTRNTEFGFKGEFWQQVQANISVYYMEVDNLQRTIQSKSPESTQTLPLVINEDREITGLELDVRWMATENLSLGLVSEIRSTDIKSPEFYNGEGTLILAQTASNDASLNYTLMLDWMPDFDMGTTNFHIDYEFVENINSEEIGLEDYKKAIAGYFYDTKNLSARLSWADDSDTFEIGLWGKNLLDQRNVISVGGFTVEAQGTPIARINRGLEAGIDLKYNF